MAKNQVSYKEAIKQLENILADIEGDNLDVDELSEKVKVATQLLKLCKEKLYNTEKDIQEIISGNKEEI
ncbi:MAG: exodeoxyribonuclease VII small subunit [Candidatus Azobacteroides sp.]|nr:exodeoxyribonuclease VII small subunit [Candidatus Azobacteroides sp.]